MDAISYGWATLTKDYVNFALPIAVAFFVANLPGQLIAFVYGIMAAALAQSLDPSVLAALNGLVQAVSGLLNFVLGAYMAGGMVAFALKVARGQPVVFGDVFSGGKYLGRMLVAGFCGGIAAFIGFLACIVPGVIVALGISQYQYLVVDQGLPGIDALKQSWEMTKGQKMNIFLFGLIGFGVIIAGVIACGIGVLLGSMPVLMHGAAYVYLSLKGERPVARA
jgi:uncharacterized membrane protein